MFVQFFKKSENQSKLSFKIAGSTDVVIGNSVQKLTEQVTTADRSYYKTIRNKFQDFGDGTYFAAKVSGSYVFAFINNSWKTATLIYKIGKSYETKEFALTRRTDKTWIYEIETTTAELIDTAHEEVVYNSNTDLTSLSQAELIAIINSLTKTVDELSKENKELAEESELAKEENVKINKRRAWNANHARNVSRKLNANFAMLRRGVNPLDMLNASADLDIVTKLDNDINYL